MEAFHASAFYVHDFWLGGKKKKKRKYIKNAATLVPAFSEMFARYDVRVVLVASAGRARR